MDKIYKVKEAKRFGGNVSYFETLAEAEAHALSIAEKHTRGGYPHIWNGAAYDDHRHFTNSVFAEVKKVESLSYWDGDEWQSFEDVELISSENGRVSGPEYRERYWLADGKTLSITFHKDRGNLGTDVEVR